MALVAFALPAGAGAEEIDEVCSLTGNGPPQLRELQPLDSKVIKVARIAGGTAGEADEWQMHLDAWFCVPGGSPNYNVVGATVEHLDANNNLIRSRTPALLGDLVVNRPGGPFGPVLLREPGTPAVGNAEDGQFPFPLPAKAQIEWVFQSTANGDQYRIVKTYPIAVQHSPRGGYFPPFRQSDLPGDQRWGHGYHGSGNQQRWALDLGVARPVGGSSWSEYEVGATAPFAANEYLAYDEPVYAMADGEVIGCNNGTPDDIPGKFGGGNHIWIRTGNEYHVYAHMRENSIPDYLCPGEEEELQRLADPLNNPPSDKQWQIEGGTIVGYVGDTGNSTKTHLHVHAQRGLPAHWGSNYTEGGLPADGRPINFMNMRVHPDTSHWDAANANIIDPPSTVPYFAKIEADPCDQLTEFPFAAEEPKINIPSQCFPDVYNTMVARGFRPVHIDIAEVGSSHTWTTIWRHADEAGWAFFYNLTEEQAEAQIFASSYETLEVESYTVGTSPRYAVILVDNPALTEFAAVGETAAEFGATYADQLSAGRFPATITVTEANDVAYISTVYEAGDVGTFSAHAGLTDYQQAFNDNAAAGRQPQWVESHVEDGQVRFAGIWYENLTGGYYASPPRDFDGIFDDYLTHTANGGFTRSLSAWHLSNQTSFRGLWRGPPVATIESGPSGPTTKDKALFRFGLSDPLAHAECKLDSKEWKPCGTSELYKNLADGKHTFKVHGVSREVITGEAAERTWKVK